MFKRFPWSFLNLPSAWPLLPFCLRALTSPPAFFHARRQREALTRSQADAGTSLLDFPAPGIRSLHNTSLLREPPRLGFSVRAAGSRGSGQAQTESRPVGSREHAPDTTEAGLWPPPALALVSGTPGCPPPCVPPGPLAVGSGAALLTPWPLAGPCLLLLTHSHTLAVWWGIRGHVMEGWWEPGTSCQQLFAGGPVQGLQQALNNCSILLLLDEEAWTTNTGPGPSTPVDSAH